MTGRYAAFCRVCEEQGPRCRTKDAAGDWLGGHIAARHPAAAVETLTRKMPGFREAAEGLGPEKVSEIIATEAQRRFK
jgi:hypothetical protein